LDQIQEGGLAAELRSSSRLIVRLENAQALDRIAASAPLNFIILLD
jgi:hypothetical protein